MKSGKSNEIVYAKRVECIRIIYLTHSRGKKLQLAHTQEKLKCEDIGMFEYIYIDTNFKVKSDDNDDND